jgi:rhamnopyranosyl-N-acetylglucosaminyl-diphospho-decaprenol beta-1,3/1,4-galactofuranosyltransferase
VTDADTDRQAPLLDPSAAAARVCAMVLTHNRRAQVKRLLVSLKAQTHPALDIVVIDNGSSDGTVEALAREMPEIRCLALESNLGVGAGYNAGLRQAAGADYHYFWLLDDEAVLAPDALAQLLKAAQVDVRCAVVGSVILNLDQRGARTSLIEFGGGRIHWGKGQIEYVGQNQAEAEWQAGTVLDVDFTHFASTLVAHSLLERIGPLHEEIFLFTNDISLSLRSRKNGGRVVLARASRVWHPQSYGKPLTPERQYYSARNHLFLFWEGGSGLTRFTGLFRILVHNLEQMLIFFFDGQFTMAGAIGQSVLTFARGRMASYRPPQALKPNPESGSFSMTRTQSLLVLALGNQRQLEEALGAARTAYPDVALDILRLVGVPDELDVSSYRVRRHYRRPAGTLGQLRLLNQLRRQHYTAALPAAPDISLLYASVARWLLLPTEAGWRIVRARFWRKLLERAVAGALSRLLAMLLTALAPVRALWTRRYYS